MAPLILGYWDLRGLAQPIKLILEHAGHEYVSKTYPIGPEPGYARPEWIADKVSLPLDFPNLPYIIDGDVKLSQSMAIMRYLGRKLGLYPVTEQEHQRVDLVQAQMVDFNTQSVRVVNDPKFESLKEEYITGLRDKMMSLSKFLGGHDYFAGSRLTFIDFIIYESLDKNRLMVPDLFNATMNLKDFMKRIEMLPNVKSFMASTRFTKWPLYGPFAYFGSRRHPYPERKL